MYSSLLCWCGKFFKAKTNHWIVINCCAPKFFNIFQICSLCLIDLILCFKRIINKKRAFKSFYLFFILNIKVLNFFKLNFLVRKGKRRKI